DQNRNVEPLLQDRARGIPPPPRIRLLRRVEDADDALPAGEAQAQVSAAAHVPGQDVDGDRIVARPAGERREPRELGRDHVRGKGRAGGGGGGVGGGRRR